MDKKILGIIFLGWLVSAGFAISASPKWVVDTKPCPGKTNVGELVHVIIPECQGGAPCNLKKNESYRVEIDFEIGKHPVEKITSNVFGIIGSVKVPWNGVGKDGCKDMLIGRCPFQVGDYITYAVNLNVLPFYPTISLTIEWEMLDDIGDIQWCFQLDVKIAP